MQILHYEMFLQKVTEFYGRTSKIREITLFVQF